MSTAHKKNRNSMRHNRVEGGRRSGAYLRIIRSNVVNEICICNSSRIIICIYGDLLFEVVVAITAVTFIINTDL